MKLINETGYDTTVLRRIVTAVHNYESLKRGKLRTWKHLTVAFAHSRRGQNRGPGYRGRASYDGFRMFLFVPPKEARVDQVIALVRHEIWHNYGIRHPDYPESVMRCDSSDPHVQQIASRFSFELIPAAEKKAKPEPTTQEKVNEKLARLAEREKRWTSKLKRAETALAKIRKSRRYYEKRLSEAAGGAG